LFLRLKWVFHLTNNIWTRLSLFSQKLWYISIFNKFFIRDYWLYVCLHLKMEFHSCARGRQWCGIFHYHWCTASIKPRLLFSHSGLVSWGLPFLQLIITIERLLYHYFYSEENSRGLLWYKKLMKGKALGKHSLHEKTAASVLLKLFISSNEWCHTTDAP